MRCLCHVGLTNPLHTCDNRLGRKQNGQSVFKLNWVGFILSYSITSK